MASRFDREIDRRNTDCLKYDFAARRGKPEGILPLWVADMDFAAPEAVLEALKKRVEHGIFGYSEPAGEGYFEALAGWFETRHGWKPEARWLIKTPGVVFAIAVAVRAYTEPGDAVLIQQPVYYPFSEVVLDNGRGLVNSPLVYEDGSYRIDFAAFEEKIIENGVKLFLLCSPHNPVGRVWTADELKRMADICLKHDVLILSDEIHADFVWEGHTHTIFNKLGQAYAERAIVCTAPSKTFNLAGLQVSNVFIQNQALRRAFRKEMNASGYSQLNTLGLTACEAAYKHGAAWLDELKEYLWSNIAYVDSFLQERLPEIRLVKPEGTYLVWLDFKALGLTEEQLEDLIVNKAGLWLDSGAMFGADGEGFERINITCTRKTLVRALEKLEKAIHSL